MHCSVTSQMTKAMECITAATTFEQQSLMMSDVRQTKAALVRVLYYDFILV